MKYIPSILIAAASCGVVLTAHAAGGMSPPSYNSSDQKLTLPFVEVISSDNKKAASFAEAVFSLQNGYFVIDSVKVNDIKNKTVIGNDANTTSNTLVQPTDDALSGGGKNQSLNFGDVIMGGYGDDILIGGLGIDVIMGKMGDDVLIGGTEDFNPENRDRAFGGPGYDAFIWAPGDGSDYFNGGSGTDVVIFGKLDEIDGEGSKSTVETDKNFDGIFMNPATNLPFADVTNSPGFCDVLDSSNSDVAELNKLGVDQLVRFTLRGKADSFESGEQKEDNGLRVTLHLKNVEYVVCTPRAGGSIEVLNIAVQPAVKAKLSDLPARFQSLIK